MLHHIHRKDKQSHVIKEDTQRIVCYYSKILKSTESTKLLVKDQKRIKDKNRVISYGGGEVFYFTN